jgi:hypothetical protein
MRWKKRSQRFSASVASGSPTPRSWAENQGSGSMRITSLKIENFRSIEAVDVGLGETIVSIGPNNAERLRFLPVSASC